MFFSCNIKEKNRVVLKNKTKTQIITKALSYSDWYSSVLGAVKSNTHIEDYVKENILKAIKSVSEEEYFYLKQKSQIFKNSKDFKDFIIFHFFEGEVICSKLYYFFSNENIVKKVSLNIDKDRVSLEESMVLPRTVLIEINILQIDDENQYQDIVILTDSKGGDIVSNLGNPNNALARLLD